MFRVLGTAIILGSMAGYAFAGFSQSAPEIDATAGVAAIGLVTGGLLILRSRRKK
jgi:hypothetical protein